jgi:CubicO group peptidase (beta-lactamase class C family)
MAPVKSPAQRVLLTSCLVATASAAILAGPQVAPPATVGSLEARLTALRETAKLPAVAGAVFTSGQVLQQSAVGVRRLGAEAPVTLDDRWHIGSITKSFTATLVAKFVERGDLKWTQTLGEVLGADRARAYASVTIEHLLSHRAGLPANLTAAMTLTLRTATAPVTAQRQQAVEALLATTPASAPGERYLYSNAGYILIAAVIEARVGRAWEDIVQAEILSPIGLSSAGFGPPGAADALAEPRGHRRQADSSLLPVEPGVFADNPPFLGPAGRLHMTIADLARWGQEHLRGERGADGLVKAATFQYLHRPPAGGDYALGWAVRTIGGRRAVWHNGSNTLWYAAVAFDPVADRGAALVTNGSIGAQAAIEGALAQLLGGS